MCGLLPTAWGITVVRVMAGIIIFTRRSRSDNGRRLCGIRPRHGGLRLPGAGILGRFHSRCSELIGGALLILGLGARWVAVLFVVEYFGTGLVIKTHRAPAVRRLGQHAHRPDAAGDGGRDNRGAGRFRARERAAETHASRGAAPSQRPRRADQAGIRRSGHKAPRRLIHRGLEVLRSRRIWVRAASGRRRSRSPCRRASDSRAGT